MAKKKVVQTSWFLALLSFTVMAASLVTVVSITQKPTSKMKAKASTPVCALGWQQCDGRTVQDCTRVNGVTFWTDAQTCKTSCYEIAKTHTARCR
ncbi:hypothetical protein A2397_03980 [Candidatus Amesbacteria bacterium RIFOXYB1_FULL_44_23]|uniref:Kazal-like domain-containing protein n=1 Tax=Candidatus Amesbacteria bacterium RIFOXYB1_FULL_44_23 TaxID=1797263 RepID=A0A1F4ZTI6_9BACT|nr:MAG: hypothetical protein A2397_03980 [Candidatus Amesbacteria bacterium RIFOXYB1_FULL_44_23]